MSSGAVAPGFFFLRWACPGCGDVGDVLQEFSEGTVRCDRCGYIVTVRRVGT
jgi:ribosomal protein S27E